MVYSVINSLTVKAQMPLSAAPDDLRKDLQHFGAYTWMHRQLWPIAAALFQAPNDYIGVGPITANHAKELSCQMSQMRKDKAKI
jgi:hypothetical protein